MLSKMFAERCFRSVQFTVSMQAVQFVRIGSIGVSRITRLNCRGVISGWTGQDFDFGLMLPWGNFLDADGRKYDAIG